MISLPTQASRHIAASSSARINVDENDEVRHWAKRCGVSELTIRIAVARVGPMVENVLEDLGSPPWPEGGGW